MRVVVSSVGRFHHFDLAQQLHRRGVLAGLYTGYPRSKVEALPPELVHSFPLVIPLEMTLWRLQLGRPAHALSWLSHETLDRWVASRLVDCDVVVCNHGNGLHTFARAKQRGGRAVCDCGLPHLEFVRETLIDECRRWGSTFLDNSPRDIAKRLEEYQAADAISVPSRFVQQTFVERGFSPAKVPVIPYGVDLSLFHPGPKADQVFRIVYAGGMTVRKGLPYLLQALAEVAAWPGCEVMLIGSVQPELKPILARYGERFRTLPYLPRSELGHYLSQGSVFVQSSILEGLSLVMAQAMACGLPVIATHNTGAEDLFTDGVEGFIVPARDPRAITERVLHLRENPTVRENMAEAALKRVRQLGGWETYGERATQHYLTLLKGRASDGARGSGGNDER